jgi:hypothetical protein
MRKTCNDCGEEKDSGEFYAKSMQCKQCTRVKHRAYYHKNREAIIKRTGEYNANHKDAISARRVASRGRTNAKAREKYWANIDQSRSKQRERWALYKDESNRKVRERRAKNKSYYRLKDRAREYGITVEKVSEILGSPCEICGESGMMTIDHCHHSGVVRGGLCSNCNAMIGQARESTKILSSAIEYILKHKGI